MSDTVYGHEPIKCEECGNDLKTIEKGHLQSKNCTGEIADVEDYRSEYPEAPTRTFEMRDKIVDNSNSSQ